MKKLVASLVFFVVLFFCFSVNKVFAVYQIATNFDNSFSNVYPENDGSGFMAPPFPRSTGIVGKNTVDGSTFVMFYKTNAPSSCSLVTKVKGSITLDSTDSTPREIGIFFGAYNKKTNTPAPGRFTVSPDANTALPNSLGYYTFSSLGETANFEYEFDSEVSVDDMRVLLAIDDADDVTSDPFGMTIGTFPDLSLSYTINSIEFDVKEITCPTIKRKKVTGHYVRKQPQEKKCPIFTQHMKEGDRDGSIGKSKQYAGVPQVISEVKLLQKTLKDQGYFTGEPNGVFGPQTKAAVKAYQAIKFNNVITPWSISKPTGWAYQATIRQLNTDLGCYQTVTLDNGVVLK